MKEKIEKIGRGYGSRVERDNGGRYDYILLCIRLRYLEIKKSF